MKKILCTCLTAAAAFAFLSAAAANLPGKLSEDGRTFWIDGGDLPLEGRGFADAEKLYQRIPDRCHPNDWGMMKMSIEMIKEIEAFIEEGAFKR